MSVLRKEIETALNRNCAENGSNTPDFVLADYLFDCLAAFDKAVIARETYYGRDPGIGPAGIPTDGRIIEIESAAEFQMNADGVCPRWHALCQTPFHCMNEKRCLASDQPPQAEVTPRNLDTERDWMLK